MKFPIQVSGDGYLELAVDPGSDGVGSCYGRLVELRLSASVPLPGLAQQLSDWFAAVQSQAPSPKQDVSDERDAPTPNMADTSSQSSSVTEDLIVAGLCPLAPPEMPVNGNPGDDFPSFGCAEQPVEAQEECCPPQTSKELVSVDPSSTMMPCEAAGAAPVVNPSKGPAENHDRWPRDECAPATNVQAHQSCYGCALPDISGAEAGEVVVRASTPDINQMRPCRPALPARPASAFCRSTGTQTARPTPYVRPRVSRGRSGAQVSHDDRDRYPDAATEYAMFRSSMLANCEFPQSCTLVVHNMRKEATQEEFIATFEGFGQIVHASVSSLGSSIAKQGLVSFATRENAEEAYLAMCTGALSVAGEKLLEFGWSRHDRTALSGRPWSGRLSRPPMPAKILRPVTAAFCAS